MCQLLTILMELPGGLLLFMENPMLRTDTACGRFCSVLKLDPKNHGW